MIHGDDIYILTDIGGTMQPVAAAKTGDININQDFIKVCAPTEGRTFRKIPTSYDWGVSCNCLLATSEYAKNLVDAERNGSSFTIQFTVCGFKVKGEAFVKSCRITSSKLSLAKMEVYFEGSGPLENGYDWDLINNTLYTYSNFADGTLTTEGNFIEDQQDPTNNTLYPPTASES